MGVHDTVGELYFNCTFEALTPDEKAGSNTCRSETSIVQLVIVVPGADAPGAGMRVKDNILGGVVSVGRGVFVGVGVLVGGGGSSHIIGIV
jgi:hypothetical protein